MNQDYGPQSQVLAVPPEALGGPTAGGTALDSILEHVVHHDDELRIIWANKAAADSVGTSREDLLGKRCYEVWQDRSSPCEGCPVHKALTTGSPEQGEMTTPDGRVWYIRAYPVCDSLGRAETAVEITMDITDRKRAETALRESEDKYRSLVEHSLQGIFVIQDMRIVFANPRLSEMTGFSIEEVMSMAPERIRSIVHPEDRERVWDRYMSRIAGECVPQQYSLRILRKDSSVCWLDLYSGLIMFRGRPAIQGALVDVSERRKTEEALRESREKYTNLFHRSNDAIFIHDFEGRIVDVNQKTLDLFGYTKTEITALRISDLHPHAALGRSGEAFKEVSERGSVSFEIDFKKKDGHAFPAEVSASVFEASGRRLIQGIVRDITERRRSEDALRASEEQHRALVENVNEVIFTLNTKGCFTYISPVIERMLGHDPMEVLSKSFNCFVHADDAPGLLLSFEKSLSGERTQHGFRVIAKDGTIRHVLASCRPMYRGEHLVGITGIMADVTESKRAGAVLRESEEAYETLVRALNHAVMTTDLSGNIKTVSGRALALHGYDDACELVGKSVFDLIASEEHGRALNGLKRTLRDGSLHKEEYPLVRKDGSRFFGQLDAALIRDANGDPKAFLTVTSDITERKTAARVLEESETRYRLFVENFPGIAFRSDMNFKLLFLHGAVEDITGYTEHELMAGNPRWDSLVHPDDLAQVKAKARSLNSDQHYSYEHEYRIVRKDGQIRWLREHVQNALDDRGRPFMVQGAIYDVTGRRLAEQCLADEKECLLHTLRRIEDGVIGTDKDGRILT